MRFNVVATHKGTPTTVVETDYIEVAAALMAGLEATKWPKGTADLTLTIEEDAGENVRAVVARLSM